MKISTKKGDAGKTDLPDGDIVSKADKRIEVLGLLDKFVAILGLARSLAVNNEVKLNIKDIQTELIKIGSGLAKAYENETESKAFLKYLDDLVEKYEGEIDLPKKFVVPGDSSASASIDVARCIARELERKVVNVNEVLELKKNYTLKYLNRLSDVLFLIARFEESY
jgi:ATP:cob(I)alamin adenosyltransferase